MTFSFSAELALGSTVRRMWLALTWVPLKRSLWASANFFSSASVALRVDVLDPADAGWRSRLRTSAIDMPLRRSSVARSLPSWP